MDSSKKPSLILYLERARFDLYSEAQNRVYNFDLQPYVSNLEIVKKAELVTQIGNLVAENKIPPGNIIIVLSENVFFSKGIPTINMLEDEEDQIQKFSDSAPFEHVEVKAYPVEGGKLIVAANQDFYKDIGSAFEQVGFSSE